MYSDASSTGYGGFNVQVMGQISHGMSSLEQSLKSSTWRELAAVRQSVGFHAEISQLQFCKVVYR